MTALWIGWTSFGRLLRDRTAMFFALLLPLVVILIVGATVGGYDTLRVGLVDQGSGALGRQLAAQLEQSGALEVVELDSVDQAQPAVRRGEVAAVVVLPAGYDPALRAGGRVDVGVMADQANTSNQAAISAVQAAVADQAARVQAAAFTADRVGGTVEQRLPLVDQVAGSTPRVGVQVETVDAESSYLPSGFSYSAPTMLLLFVFINALAGGAAMIQSRRLGIYERALAAPVAPRTIVLGETICYFALALMQSVLIVGAGAVLFDVDWGDPAAAVLLVGLWALVGTGTGMLSGTLFRTPEQASAIGPAVGIALGMLGGCMWPLEIVGPTMRTIGHVAPHAWAVDAWVVLLARGGGVVDVALQLAVLAGFAVVLIALASLRMRRRLLA